MYVHIFGAPGKITCKKKATGISRETSALLVVDQINSSTSGALFAATSGSSPNEPCEHPGEGANHPGRVRGIRAKSKERARSSLTGRQQRQIVNTYIQYHVCGI